MQPLRGASLEARSARNHCEWPIVIGLLLIAFFFRVWQLNDVPPGLHHDEVIIGQVAKDILRGHFAIYFTPGYGHEPLYHYVVAGMFGALGANAFVLRLTSAFIAMLGLATTYVFVRRIFSPVVAIGTLAWMSISLWPIFFARVGLRGITLPLLTTLTAYFLWRALFGRQTIGHGPQTLESSALSPQPSAFVLPGILLGLTLYTYQASRVFPVIFAAFMVYLFLLRRLSKKSSSFIPARVPAEGGAGRSPSASPAHGAGYDVAHPSSLSWRAVAVFFLIALIVAAPLIIYLAIINPSAEARIAELSGPLNKLLAGDASEVISSTLNTLGMFTYRGDAVPIYNLSGRPVFPEIVGAALFVIGLLISLWRWKRPVYALMLIWFFISLIPAMVTPFSPNFVRTIASWPVPFVFAGVAMNEAIRGVIKIQYRVTLSRVAHHLVIGLFVLVLVWNAWLTANDYFRQWPTGDYVRFWQQATWTQAVRALNAETSTAPVAASGLSIHDFDPQTFDLLGLRSELKVKWFDCRNAILYPVDMEQSTIRYLSPPFFKCDDDLKASYLPGIRTIEQPQWQNSGDTIFLLEQFERPWTLSQLLLPRVMTSTLYLGAENFDPISPTRDLVQLGPPDFEGLLFYGNTPHPDTLAPGATLTFDTLWELTRPISGPLKIFIHITAPDGKIVAQWDGLDVNVGTLDMGDIFVQRHRLNLPADLPPGPYRISIGAYHPNTDQRLKAEFDGRTVDSLVLGALTVQ